MQDTTTIDELISRRVEELVEHALERVVTAVTTRHGTRTHLSIDEAATAIGCSRSKAYQMARSGELPTLKLGRRKVVPVRALEQLGMTDD